MPGVGAIGRVWMSGKVKSVLKMPKLGALGLSCLSLSGTSSPSSTPVPGIQDAAVPAISAGLSPCGPSASTTLLVINFRQFKL